MFKKILAVIMVCAVLIYILRGYFLIVVGLFILIIIVRFVADIFWWGKDKGKW